MNERIKSNIVNENNMAHQNKLQNLYEDVSQIDAALKFEKTFKYWAGLFEGLMRQDVVVFTAYDNYKMIKMSPVQVIRQLISLDLLNDIEGMDILSNACFYYIRFTNSSKAAIFQNATRQLDNSLIKYVMFQEKTEEYLVTVESIPPIVVRETFKESLDKFCTLENIKPTLVTLPGGKVFESAPTTFCIKLKQDITLEEVPYFVLIGNLKAYLKIQGRAPICYNCGFKDHVSRGCPYRYCNTCRKMNLIQHICNNSYADKVKFSNTNINEIYQQAIEDQFPELGSEEDTGQILEVRGAELTLQHGLPTANEIDNFYSLLLHENDNPILFAENPNIESKKQARETGQSLSEQGHDNGKGITRLNTGNIPEIDVNIKSKDTKPKNSNRPKGRGSEDKDNSSRMKKKSKISGANEEQDLQRVDEISENRDTIVDQSLEESMTF